MRKLQSNRRLGIESLENRVVFADDLVMIDVNSLIRWNIISRESEFATEFQNMSVPVSRARLAMLGEGEWYLNTSTPSPSNSHANVTAKASFPSTSSSVDSAATIHDPIGSAEHPANRSFTTHVTAEISTQKAPSLASESDLLSLSPLLSPPGPSSTEPIKASNESRITRSFVQSDRSSLTPEMQVSDQLAKFQRSRTLETTAAATMWERTDTSSESDKPLDEIVDLWCNRHNVDAPCKPSAPFERKFEGRQGTDLLEDGRKELFAEYFYTISLPDAKSNPTDHSWSLLFGMVGLTSPFSTDVERSESPGVREAVLEIVAESERSKMSSAASLTTYSSADWKATSILATVFAALFYRNKQQQDLVPSLLTRFPKQQLPSGRRRR
jgi:hypothetical protein